MVAMFCTGLILNMYGGKWWLILCWHPEAEHLPAVILMPQMIAAELPFLLGLLIFTVAIAAEVIRAAIIGPHVAARTEIISNPWR
jgi:hypothetical protein